MSQSDGGLGPRGEDNSRTAAMNDHEKSDNPIRPKKQANKALQRAAESVEERRLAKGNQRQSNMRRTQGRKSGMSSGLERVRLAASRDKELKFTALLHHITPQALLEAFEGLNPKACPGVDGVEWKRYKADALENVRELHDRVHRGAYRAVPSKRAYIPKPDGGRRPLGIAAVEDKIVQTAVAKVLGAIYEEDFLGFSYGFRPGRDCHRALDALAYGITRRKVNWVLDADIRGYFDSIDHESLLRYLEHRIGDPRILRLIRKWLKAGVLEDGVLQRVKEGTPQGASISPLLANVYLHYVFDTWAHQWRKSNARGDVVIVRYADDFVVGFQHREEAVRFQEDLRRQLAANHLELHPEKTRLLEFGRFASENRQRRGLGKPESFDFLGFTHICGRSRKGKFLLRRHTIKKRFRRTVRTIRDGLRRRMCDPVEMVGTWLCRVLQGYYRYFAVPTNLRILQTLRKEVAKAWLTTLRRRSHKDHTTWDDMIRLMDRWLPRPQYCHPWPDERMQARLTRGRSPVR